MARDRYRIYPGSEPYFLTCTIVGWLPVFTRQETVQIVLDSWKFLQAHQRLTLFGYVILENHLHFIATSPDLAKEVGDFKSFTGHEIIGVLKSRGADTLLHQLEFHKEAHKRDRRYQLWQEGSHPKALQNEEMMRQKLEYMHMNPVRRGYVDEAVHWRYSSARNYAGMPGLIDVVADWLY